MVTTDAAEEYDVSLELSSKTETVESFSKNYVPESEVVALFCRGSTGDPIECPPARNQYLSPIFFSNHLVMVAQSSLSLTFILLESSIMLLNWIADMIPLMPPTQYLISLLPRNSML